MTVAITDATETAAWEGGTYSFCGSGCRRRFESDPEKYLEAVL
jgi:YHS domain-containing protein